jgi:hypothetical protein
MKKHKLHELLDQIPWYKKVYHRACMRLWFAMAHFAERRIKGL